MINQYHVWFWQAFGGIIGIATAVLPLAGLFKYWGRVDREMLESYRRYGGGGPYVWPDRSEKVKRWVIGIAAVVTGLTVATVILPDYSFD